MDAFSYFAGLIVIIAGFILFAFLAVATKGFKHPSNEKKKDDQGPR